MGQNNFFLPSSSETFVRAEATNFTDLENNYPASDFQISDKASVLFGENEFFSSKVQFWTAPKYEKPAGIYIVRNDIDTNPANNYWDLWQEQTINSLKTVILDVTEDWTKLFNANPNFRIDQIINYQGKLYQNISGSFSSTVPDQDGTNWKPFVNTNNVNWVFPYVAETYPANTMTRIDNWLMMSNKETAEYPAPTPVGDPAYLYLGTAGTEKVANGKQVVFGIRVSKNTGYWVEGYRVYVIAGNEYEIISVKDPLGVKEATFVNRFVADETGWRNFSLQPIPVGESFTFDLLAIETQPDPTPVVTTANYNYQKPNNETIPLSGQITHSVKLIDELWINYTDNDLTDRTTLIQSLVPGSQIEVSGKVWSVQDNTDLGTYAIIGIAPPEQANVLGVQSFDFSVPPDVSLTYFEEAGFWLGNTETKGLFIVDQSWENVAQNDNAYGLDVFVQPATVSEDWDLVSYSGIGGGGGTTPSGNEFEYIDLIQQATGEPEYQKARFFYNNEQTIRVYSDDPNVVKELGHTLTSRFRNDSGVVIPRGKVCCIKDKPQQGILSCDLATNDSYNENWILGVSANETQPGEFVEFFQKGIVQNIDTSGLVDGQPIYLSNIPGELTNDRPLYPQRAYVIGANVFTDVVNGVFGINVVQDQYDYSFDGCIVERHDTFIEVVGSQVFMDIEKIGGGDLPIQLGSKVNILNCTTGAGVNGRARVELPQGTVTQPQDSIVYIDLTGGVPTLKTSTAYPPVPFAFVSLVSIRDFATVSIEGADSNRRITSAINHDGRGSHSYTIERTAIEPPIWYSGVTPTALIDTVPTPDLLDLSVIAGVVYQRHRQDFPELSVSTDGVYLANGPGTPSLDNYTKYSNLTLLCGYTSSPIARDTSSRGHLVVFGVINKTTQECKLFVNLPSELYGGADSTAYFDPNNTADYTVPDELRFTAFLIARIPYDISGGGDIVNFINPIGSDEIINLLGNPIGVSGGSSGTGSLIPNLAQVLAQGNDGGNSQMKNITDPTDPQDVVTQNYLFNREMQWIRTETNLTVTKGFQKVDVFPSSNNVVITLPDPSTLENRADIRVFNQTNREYVVLVKDHLGVTIKTIEPVRSFDFFFYPGVPSSGIWETVQSSGLATGVLPISPYADFNNIVWGNVASGFYTITGVGSDFINSPYTLNTVADYTFDILIKNTPSVFKIEVDLSSTTDPTNDGIGRACRRIGPDFGSATSVGWKCNALTTDP